MALSSQNPLMGSYSPSQQNVQMNGYSPQEWEYIQQIRRTGYDQNQFQQQPMNGMQTDPYTDFEMEFSKCSPSVQNRILNDDSFKESMSECDRLVQATIEAIVRPQVMQTRDGRMAFERLLATFRNVKDGYVKQESDNMAKIQKLMQDDVVRQRLAEIEKGIPPSSSSVNNMNRNNGGKNNG